MRYYPCNCYFWLYMKKLFIALLLLPCCTFAQTADSVLQSGNQKAGKKDYTGAVADFTKAININAKDPNAFFYRANAYDNLHNDTAAVNDFTEVLALNPSYPNGNYYKANAENQFKNVCRSYC